VLQDIDMNKLDERQQLFAITAEECGELTQACMKVMRIGDFPPEGKVYQDLVQEVGDVLCMMDLLHEWDVFSWEDVEEAAKRKRKKLEKWSDLI
jgi:NTP pyrophosphatase (non-canonical NTP hydrolase)